MSFMQNQPARQVMELAFSGNKGPNARSPEELSTLMAQFRASPGVKTSPSRNPLPGQMPQQGQGALQGQMGSPRPEMDQLFSGIGNMQSPSFMPAESPGYDWASLLQRLGAASNQFAQMGGAQPGYQPQQPQEQPRINMFQNMFERNR